MFTAKNLITYTRMGESEVDEDEVNLVEDV
jgi:hypothetical protein